MALGIAEIIILGLLVDWIARRLKVPGLVGMLLLGVVAGPFVLNFLQPGILDISHDLRLIALIVILLRAGFELSRRALAKVGRMAMLLSCVPAIFEAAAITLLGPTLLGLTYMESAILGAILAAVSPAVVVPLMINFIEKRKGVEKAIPTLLLAASSIDDVFVIVIYSVLIGMYTGSGESVAWRLAGIPISIITGIAAGLLIGWVLYKFFSRFNPRATKRVLIILGVSIFLIKIEHSLEGLVPFAALLAVMGIGVIILEKREHYAHEISSKLGKIWVLAELVLFIMVGAQVNISVAWHAGLMGALLIFLGLVARSVGTYTCLFGSDLNIRERLFVVISYLPKATVQAAIGAAPLAAMKAAGMPTQPGELILAIAVLSILLTAPIGAWAISLTGDLWLEQAPEGDYEAVEAAKESD
ncbi:MAG: sodium:proton antiporter [Kiritimatiellaeota bacterium]|nr:sodium:proton antiporter [Kiritimatiellota bacterium]